MRVGSLFSGIGGMALAARWMGWETSFFAEVDPYASAVLAKHFPGVPNYGDVKEITGQVGSVDMLTGGFPCQDISNAGKRAGITGERSGLWKEYARLIGEIQPKYALIENVSALRGRGLDVVLSDLDAIGYDAEWHCIPASAVGAPHRRDRIWVVAYPKSARLEGWITIRDEIEAPHLRLLPARQGQPHRTHEWSTEPDVGRVAHGIPSRVDRLRCLGNSVVPQIPLLIFRAIAAREHRLDQEIVCSV